MRSMWITIVLCVMIILSCSAPQEQHQSAPDVGAALKSVHHFNLPSEITEAQLASALSTMNKVVADLGYPDAGYRLWKVRDGRDAEYQYLFEGNWPGQKGYDVIHESEAYKQLPSCQVVLITSTSIVNHTIDGILDAAHLCREVVLLGASTPMFPEAFAGTPVTLLSGVVVTRPQEIMDIVGTGGGVRRFKNHIRKVNLHLKKR